MFSTQNISKTFGILFLTQVSVGLFVQFGLMSSLIIKPSFLVSDVEPGLKTGAMVLLSFFIGFVNLLIAAFCSRTFKKQLPILTQFLVIFAAAKFAISMFEITKLMEMVSYANNYASADSATKELLQTMSSTLTAGRNWAHYIQVSTSGVFIFIFYVMMLKSTNLPKLLCMLAITCALLQIAAVTQPFFGQSVPMIMLAPIGLVQFAMPLYFIFKGFIVTKNDLND